MNQNFKEKISSVATCALVISIGVFSSCGHQNQKFEKISSETVNTMGEDISSTPPVQEPPAPVPDIQPPTEQKILTIQGLATGVASLTQPDVWEKWAPRGTTIQLNYSIGGLDTLSTAFQIVKRGSVVSLGQALDSSSLAQGEDGQTYSFAQYFNLEKSVGGYIFNLPLKYSSNVSSPAQYLKVGLYSIYITACSGSVLSTCKISDAIDFEVR